MARKICSSCGQQIDWDMKDKAWFHLETGDIHGEDGHPAVVARTGTRVPPPATFQSPHGGAPVVYIQQPKTNGLAIASLVLGIVWLYWIGSLLALIFGYTAKEQIDRSEGAEGGRGLAVAGIVLGWIGVGFLGVALLVYITAVSGASS